MFVCIPYTHTHIHTYGTIERLGSIGRRSMECNKHSTLPSFVLKNTPWACTYYIGNGSKSCSAEFAHFPVSLHTCARVPYFVALSLCPPRRKTKHYRRKVLYTRVYVASYLPRTFRAWDVKRKHVRNIVLRRRSKSLVFSSGEKTRTRAEWINEFVVPVSRRFPSNYSYRLEISRWADVRRSRQFNNFVKLLLFLDSSVILWVHDEFSNTRQRVFTLVITVVYTCTNFRRSNSNCPSRGRYALRSLIIRQRRRRRHECFAIQIHSSVAIYAPKTIAF